MSVHRYSFNFNGVDYHDAFGVLVRGYDYPMLPRPRLFIRDYAVANGAVVQGVSYEPLRIALSCVAEYEDATEPIITLRAIADALNATVGAEQPLILGWEPNRVYHARLESDFAPDRGLTHAMFQLAFICPNPIPDTIEGT